MGSCSNKGGNTKQGIVKVVVPGKHVSTEPTENHQEKSIPDKAHCPDQSRRASQMNSQMKIEIDNLARNTSKIKDIMQIKVFSKINIIKNIIEAATAQVSNPVKNQSEINLIKNCLAQHFLFSQLLDQQKNEMISFMKLYKFGTGKNVYEEKQPGSLFFIIAKGTVEVIVSGEKVNMLETGMSFGEGALLQNVPRTATINTVTDCEFWGLNREEFRRVIAELNAANFEENMNIVKNTTIFQELTYEQKEALVETMSMVVFEPDSYITKEGESGDLMYIIKEGNAICTKENVELCHFAKGECFGEQALFFKTTRKATIIALDHVKCLSITGETLSKVLGNGLQTIIYKNSLRLAIKSSKYLKKLSKLQEELLIRSMAIGDFPQGSVIIPANTEKSSDLIFLLKGELNGPCGHISALKILGEAEIVENSSEIWPQDIIAESNITIGYISRALFEETIGGKYSECVGNNNKIRLLKSVPLFRTLTTEQYNGIIKAMRLEEYGDGQIIFEENDHGESLFIIKSGMVDIMKKGNYLRSVSKNDYFGERSILFSSPRTATAVANGRVVVWVLVRADFLAVINDKIRYNLIKRIELQDETIKMQDLKIVKLLGKGLTGIVFLAVHQQKKILYALKTVHRQKIYEYNMYTGIQLEKDILLQLDHTFIMKLVKTFKDAKRIYFLTEYVRGMDLFDVIRAMNFVSEKHARFFVGSLMLVLEDLHEKAIAYRDLKPENVVVDDEGYLKLIDFGTAKFIKGRTFTVLGTPQYMAPEVIMGTGYAASVDLWSLGIMMFEFLFGYVPFGETDTDPMVVYEKVLERNIVYPTIPADFYVEARNLIEQLLNKNPVLRNGGSSEILKKHKWFSNFDWDLVISRQEVPPYIPKLSKIENEVEKALAASQMIEEIISKEETFVRPGFISDVEEWEKYLTDFSGKF